ncbi:hypothetical protein [Kangiella sp.]|uniref:hypothetical protein n=1 Tax=Kangiella sp. TaxID=1920245 RepID=UPI00199392E8|nr:hypothetical protein [Kangiella sp.]MBD3653529.1 hypothetical protein [Kangiella sp.]
MKTKVWITLILITAALAGAYFYTKSKQPSPQNAELSQSQEEDVKAENVIETSELLSNHPEADSVQRPNNKAIDSTTAQKTDKNIVKLIDSIEQNGALSTNEIQKLMSNPKAFDDALYKLEESYYEPEYSYETKVKYQHFFNTSPFHLQGKAQLSNLQCSPKMCLAKVAGIQREQLTEYTQSVQSSEDLPIKALAVGFNGNDILLAFSTDPEVNAFITRKETDE